MGVIGSKDFRGKFHALLEILSGIRVVANSNLVAGNGAVNFDHERVQVAIVIFRNS